METERFVLLPVAPFTTARRTLHWTNDAEGMAFMGWRTTGWTFGLWWRHFRSSRRKGNFAYEIWPKTGDKPIGLYVLTVDAKNRSYAGGVIIGEKDWRGKRVVPEVRMRILEDCFQRLGAHRISNWVYANNDASLANQRKSPYKTETIARRAGLVDGKRVDIITYGLLRDEWFAMSTNQDQQGAG